MKRGMKGERKKGITLKIVIVLLVLVGVIFVFSFRGITGNFLGLGDLDKIKYMRSWETISPSGEWTQAQIWNPKNSGVEVILKKVIVGGGASKKFTIVSSGTQLATKPYGENGVNKGLPAYPYLTENPDFYSKAIIRQQYDSPSRYVLGGQYARMGDPMVMLEEDIEIPHGSGIIVRSEVTGAEMRITFVWEEIKL